jgi:hypothetical protein
MKVHGLGNPWRNVGIPKADERQPETEYPLAAPHRPSALRVRLHDLPAIATHEGQRPPERMFIVFSASSLLKKVSSPEAAKTAVERS